MMYSKWTESQYKKLEGYFLDGMTFLEIGKRMDCSADTAKRKTIELLENGIMSELDKEKVEKEFQQIKEYVKKGYRPDDIAAIMKVSQTLVSNRIGILLRRKELPKNFTTLFKHKKADATLEYGETVNCTTAVSEKCVYGVSRNGRDAGLCRYIQCTNQRRGCSYKACNKFSQISKTNPRRDIIELDLCSKVERIVGEENG